MCVDRRATYIREEHALWFEMNDHSADFAVRVDEIFQTKETNGTHVPIITPEDVDLQFTRLNNGHPDHRRSLPSKLVPDPVRSYNVDPTLVGCTADSPSPPIARCPRGEWR